MFPGHDGDRLVCKAGVHPVSPRGRELHAVDRSQNVDTQRGDTNLEDKTRFAEVRFGQIV